MKAKISKAAANRQSAHSSLQNGKDHYSTKSLHDPLSTRPKTPSNPQGTSLGDGHPLPESVRGFFDARFGYDFRRVRIHTDHSAASLSRRLNAKAFTVGRAILFGSGQYAPGTREGRRLLAHELAHVIQKEGQEIQPDTLQRKTTTEAKVPSYFESPQKAFRRYETRRAELDRFLRLIRRTRNRKLKKSRQIQFLRTIYAEIIGFDPFQVIDVKGLRQDNAVIEWIDETDQSKGLKVTFNELLFGDSLEYIIITALHESVHARQMKSGIPMKESTRPGKGEYYLALTSLAETEAYAAAATSPFFKKLSKSDQSKYLKLLERYAKRFVDAYTRLKGLADAGFGTCKFWLGALIKKLPKFKILGGILLDLLKTLLSSLFFPLKKVLQALLNILP
jgi:hypothetical protein